MTRLYVDIICTRCGESYGVSDEVRYAYDAEENIYSPQDITEGLCLNCQCVIRDNIMR